MLTYNHTYSVAIAVLSNGKGQAFVNKAIQLGLKGGFIASAKGMIESNILNQLGIHDRKRQVVIIPDERQTLEEKLPQLAKYFKMNQPNHGVIFLLHTNHDINQHLHLIDNDWKPLSVKHELIMTTFRHERRIEITNKLKELGAEGGTLITGRGQFNTEIQKMLGINFAPQKDILLTVTPSEKVQKIFQGLDDYYSLTQTKGMRIHSFDVPLFSQDLETVQSLNNILLPSLSMLVSIISEDLKDAYLKFIHQQGCFGGTALKAHGTLSESNNEKIFNMQINPQKLIIFTVDQSSVIQQTFQQLILDSKLNQEHQSIFFTIPVNQAFGIS